MPGALRRRIFLFIAMARQRSPTAWNFFLTCNVYFFIRKRFDARRISSTTADFDYDSLCFEGPIATGTTIRGEECSRFDGNVEYRLGEVSSKTAFWPFLSGLLKAGNKHLRVYLIAGSTSTNNDGRLGAPAPAPVPQVDIIK